MSWLYATAWGIGSGIRQQDFLIRGCPVVVFYLFPMRFRMVSPVGNGWPENRYTSQKKSMNTGILNNCLGN